MQLGRCCKCGNGAASGYWVRHCRIQDLTLNDIGTESLAWSLRPLGGGYYTQWWEITDNGSLMNKGDTALCYGVRYDTWMPTTEGELWNGMVVGGGGNPNIAPGIDYRVLSEFGGSGDIIFTNPDIYARRTNLLMTETCPSGGNVVGGKIHSIVCPYSTPTNFTTGGTVNIIIRPRYYRILHNGIPITDILDGVDTTATQFGRPSTDIANSGWTGVGNPTVLAQNINETAASETDYNYSGNNTVATVTHSCPAALNAHAVTGVKVRYRIARSDAGSIPGSASPGNSLNVTVSVLSGVTLVASETRAVPADPTSYEWTLSDAECVALSTTTARIKFETTASGGGASDQRGCAVFWAEIESPTEWVGTWTDLSLSSTGTVDVGQGLAWLLPESLRRYSFAKRKRFGIDVWYEIQKTNSTYPFYLTTGWADSSVYGTGQPVAHGLIGSGVTFNNGFDPDKHTYKLTFNGGVWRPLQATGDDFTFSPADNHTGGIPVINTDRCYNRNRIASGIPTDDGILLAWACEVPYLILCDFDDPDWPALTDSTYGQLIYVPENHANAIRKLKRDGTGNIYQYWQNVGGHWKGDGETTFVPLFKKQDNTTGIFTDVDFVDFPAVGNDWPTSVTVVRVDQ